MNLQSKSDFIEFTHAYFRRVVLTDKATMDELVIFRDWFGFDLLKSSLSRLMSLQTDFSIPLSVTAVPRKRRTRREWASGRSFAMWELPICVQ